MNQFDQFESFSSPLPLLPLPVLLTNTSNASDALSPPPLAIYPFKQAPIKAVRRWSKSRGYAFTIVRGKKLRSGRQKVYYACDRYVPVRLPREASIRDAQSRATGCPFAVVALETPIAEWELKYCPEADNNTRNRLPRQSPAANL